MRNQVALLAMTLTCAGSLSAQNADSTAWMRRPAIRAVRAIVQEVQARIDQQQLTRSDTTMCGGGPLQVEFRVYRDRRGVIRRLIWRSASEDHGEVDTFTYDSLGTLRFSLSQQAAANGSKGEVRSYWSAAGTSLHVDIRTIEGDGYPWAPPVPAFNPTEALARGCEE